MDLSAVSGDGLRELIGLFPSRDPPIHIYERERKREMLSPAEVLSA